MDMRWVALAIVSTACSSDTPEIHDLSDQTATVGVELVVMIDGTDPDGDRLTYAVHSDVMLQDNASLTQTPDGMGVFRWTPLAEDLGMHSFDFTVDNGSTTTTDTITINVVADSGTVPVFREPIGDGTVVDLTTMPCPSINIVIEDDDNPTVTIAEEDPQIPGAQLSIIDGLTATWTWCPTAMQAMQSRYTLVLSADDGSNPKTIKNYVIVFNTDTGGPHLVINEIDYDQPGVDNAEYVEIFNPSTSSASLAGIHVVLVNGSNNAVYDTIDLSDATSLDGGQYLVIAGPNVSIPAGAMSIDPVWSQDQIQNGSPDGIALVDSAALIVIDALSYGGSITAATIPGFAAPVSLVEGTPLPLTVVDSNTVTRSLCRIPNGADTNNSAADWAICSTLTPGAANIQ